MALGTRGGQDAGLLCSGDRRSVVSRSRVFGTAMRRVETGSKSSQVALSPPQLTQKLLSPPHKKELSKN